MTNKECKNLSRFFLQILQIYRPVNNSDNFGTYVQIIKVFYLKIGEVFVLKSFRICISCKPRSSLKKSQSTIR